MKITRGDFIIVGILCLLFAGCIFLSKNHHTGYKCINCNVWQQSADMVEVVPVDELAKVTKAKLRLCKSCAKHPKRLNIRNIERRERFAGVSEGEIAQHAFLAQQLMTGSKFVRIQENNGGKQIELDRSEE